MQEIDLGFAEECESEWLTNAHFPSKLGGKPAWLHLGDLPSTEALKCSKCNNQKSFLCQIYAPFDDDYNFHRMVYVFVCRTESCFTANDNSNITVLRSQLPLRNEFYPDVPPPEEGEAAPEVLPPNTKLCLACGCVGPLKCGRCKKANYCGAPHQRLHWKIHKLTCTTEDSVSAKAQHQPIPEILFPEWEIDINTDEDVNNDTTKDLKSDIDEEQELKKLEQLTASGKAGEFQNLPESELEKYTKGSEEIDDKYFRKFRKECDKDPMQIIRYKRNGQVLWIADTETTIKEQLYNIPKCGLCGAERVFEFQIMPQMLNYLKDSNVDWGVIAVYTCPKSCPLPKDKGYVEEFCLKQDIVNSQ
ncbi:programmed cell death protein 2 [Lucilia sericata]|uniref:programmed cell death protein 2 n=1 Tax=Lucilia sericata TaxID=13632 RepID=UPI0018A84840|nr:programmed cell death protein 2 [Lucilia sericata]